MLRVNAMTPIGTRSCEHWHAERGAEAAEALRLGKGVVGVGQHVGNLDDLSFEQGTSVDGGAFELDRDILDQFHELGREPVGFRAVEHPLALARNRALVGIAKPGRRLDERVQHCL